MNQLSGDGSHNKEIPESQERTVPGLLSGLSEGHLAQRFRASRLHRGGRGFESLSAHLVARIRLALFFDFAKGKILVNLCCRAQTCNFSFFKVE